MNEIIFNSKGNYTDFKTVLNYFKPQPPSPKIIKDSVPFMNGSYNFSTVGSNGELVFSDRKIPCSIEFKSKDKSLLLNKYSELLEWLYSGTHDLIYTGEPNMKYIAYVEDVPGFDYFLSHGGKLEFAFTADPFKYGVDLEGDKNWDTFNFEIDYLQGTEFDVVGTRVVTIYNTGRAVVPLISADSSFSCDVNGYTANFVAGDMKDWKFRLLPGANEITISGTGHIKFTYRKELL